LAAQALPILCHAAETGRGLPPSEIHDASLSPDGRTLVVWGIQPLRLRDARPPTSIRVIDIPCLTAAKPRCVDQLAVSTFPIGPAHWVREANEMLLHTSNQNLVLRQSGGLWRSEMIKSSAQSASIDLPDEISADKLRRVTEGLDFENPASVWRSQQREGQGATAAETGASDPLEKFAWAGRDGQGRIAYWLEQTGDEALVYDRSGLVARLPRYLVSTPFFALRYARRFTVRARGDGFFLWLGSNGDNGELTRFTPGRRTTYRLPAKPRSPLQPVFAPSASHVLGVFDADRFYPLETTRRRGSRLDAFVRRVRQQAPNLELVAIKGSETGVSLLKFRGADGDIQWRLFDADTNRDLNLFEVLDVPEHVGPLDEKPPPISSQGVRITSPSGDLPARLYRGAPSPSRGLIVTFHGGPGVNTLYNAHQDTRRLVRIGFDVLDVDYRGSPGYGWRHFSALRGAMATVIPEDLAATVRWARTQSAYQNGRIGFYGISAGGIAGVAAASRPVEGLDFLVLDAAFIAWPPPTPGSQCAAEQYWAVQVWGAEQTSDGCRLGGGSGLDARTASRTPTLMLVGARDRQTDPAIAAAWFDLMGRLGGCVEMVSSSTGGHGLVNWSTLDQQAGEAALQSWIDAIERGDGRQTCGRRIMLGTVPAA
jgi:dipeptidyl aminopeptidase/acylaminoacyl peptidase